MHEELPDVGPEGEASQEQAIVPMENAVAPVQEDLEQAEMLQRSLDLALIQELMRDPVIQEGLKAALRTMANAGLTVAEAFPVVGEAVDAVPDIVKVVVRLVFKNGKLDITPDVSLGATAGFNIADLATVGLVPSRAVEALMQFRADLPRMRQALARYREHLAGQVAEYASNTELQQAVHAFDDTPKLSDFALPDLSTER